MLKIRTILVICLFCTVQPGHVQSRPWGKLEIQVSEGWSIKQKAGFVQLSNYNLTNAEPFTITLFENQSYNGKPDTLFAYAWKRFVTSPPTAPEIPKWRRFYTEEGLLILQGFAEFTKADAPLYRQLNVILLPGSFQACMLETSTSKNYRLLQTEWMERLQGVKQINTGKK